MGVAFPVHEVLQLTSSSMSPGVQDGLDLVLLFTIDDRRRACEGRAICLRLLIGKEEVDVKDIVDLHRWRESEFVGDRTDLLHDREGSISFLGRASYSRRARGSVLRAILGLLPSSPFFSDRPFYVGHGSAVSGPIASILLEVGVAFLPRAWGSRGVSGSPAGLIR